MVRDGHFSKRWKFDSFLEGESLVWCKTKQDGWELKEGGKKGRVVARLGLSNGLVLRFEETEGEGEGGGKVDERRVEEVVLSAVAVVEGLRRSRNEQDWDELGDEIGNLGTAGGDGGGVSVGVGGRIRTRPARWSI